MADHDIQVEQLERELTLLVEFVPRTKDELHLWYEEAQCLKENFFEGPDRLSPPHFLWHYLSDADIRMKDEVYAEMQVRRVNLLLEHLKRGVMPSDEDV